MPRFDACRVHNFFRGPTVVYATARAATSLASCGSVRTLPLKCSAVSRSWSRRLSATKA